MQAGRVGGCGRVSAGIWSRDVVHLGVSMNTEQCRREEGEMTAEGIEGGWWATMGEGSGLGR
jgi:hypothetical protein